MNKDRIAQWLLDQHFAYVGDTRLLPKSLWTELPEVVKDDLSAVDIDRGLYCTEDLLVQEIDGKLTLIGMLNHSDANVPSLFIKSGSRKTLCESYGIAQDKEFNRTFDLAVREAQTRLVKYFLNK